jgi:hypothetical protein
MLGFHEAVQHAWDRDINQSLNPLTILHAKLGKTAKALKSWAKTLIPQGKITMAIYREVMGQLEKAHEFRQLSQGECILLKRLKRRILGLAAIEKNRVRQRSRLTWLRLGDANTKYFHLIANKRKQRNFIHNLLHENVIATTQEEKQELAFQHYINHIGSYIPRSCTLNLSELGWQGLDLHQLDLPFSENEIKMALMSAPKEKAPGPDGYIGILFLKMLENH